MELFSTLEEFDRLVAMYLAGYPVREFSELGYTDDHQGSPCISSREQTDTSLPQNKLIARLPQTHEKRLHLQNKSQPRSLNTSAVGKNSEDSVCQTISAFVVQKYIEAPLLYFGFKFDIRVFVVVTQNLKVLLCKESYVRLASLPYNLKSKNYYVHLTNNAVQANSGSYGALVKGNIFSTQLLDSYVKSKSSHPKAADFSIQNSIQARVMRIFSDLNLESRDVAGGSGSSTSFEMFGLDFILDESLHLWLLEMNSNASLSESNAYMSRLLHRAMDDLFRETLDKIYPPPAYAMQSEESIYQLPGYRDKDNLWQTILLPGQLTRAA